jgi:hypothetical protein
MLPPPDIPVERKDAPR